MNSSDNGSTTGVSAPETVDTCTAAGTADLNKQYVTCAVVTGDNSDNTTATTTDSVGGNRSVADDDLRFGYCCFRPKRLQWLNNATGAVAIICIANAVQGFANGLFGVMLSTIEKRFDLSSSDSSIIAIGYELGPIPIIVFFTFFGNRCEAVCYCGRFMRRYSGLSWCMARKILVIGEYTPDMRKLPFKCESTAIVTTLSSSNTIK